jgi:hypothetical protein
MQLPCFTALPSSLRAAAFADHPTEGPHTVLLALRRRCERLLLKSSLRESARANKQTPAQAGANQLVMFAPPSTATGPGKRTFQV